MHRLRSIVFVDLRLRLRNRSFWFVLGAACIVAWWCFPAKDSDYLLLALDGKYRGAYSSAWAGMTVAMTSLWLTLIGFYLVRGSITRDIDSQLWQLLAATPMRASTYLLAKWCSHLAVLVLILVAMLLVALAAQLLRAEDRQIDLIELAKPVLLLSVPSCAITAMFAVWFDLVPALRRSAGNVAYFCVWIGMLAATQFSLQHPLSGAAAWIGDPVGVSVFANGIGRAVLEQHGVSTNAVFCMVCAVKGAPVVVDWSVWRIGAGEIFGRGFWLLLAAGGVALAAPLCSNAAPAQRGAAPVREDQAPRRDWLAKCTQPLHRTRFGAMLAAELQLTLRHNSRWWWGAMGLAWCVQLIASNEQVALAIVAVWVLLLGTVSRAALRELDAGTGDIVFSADVRSGVLRARWVALLAVSVLANLPALVHTLLTAPAIAWATVVVGASLVTWAMALGTLTGNGRTYELLVCVLAYFAFNDGFVLNVSINPLRTALAHFVVMLPIVALLLFKRGRARFA